MRALLQLEWWQFRNRLRRLLRSPGWLVFYGLIVVGFVAVMVQVARLSAVPGNHEVQAEAIVTGFRPPATAVLAGWALVAMLMSLYGAPRRPPVIFSSADVSLLLPAPISPRVVLAGQFLRQLFLELLRAIPNLVWSLLVLMKLDYPVGFSGVFSLLAAFVLIHMVAELVGAVGWLAVHRKPAEQAARTGRRLRAAVVVVATILAVWALWPAFRGQGGQGVAGIRPALEVTFERLEKAAELPPLRWLASFGLPFEWQFAREATGAASRREAPGWPAATREGFLATLLLVGALAAAALHLAEDYYEPAVAQTQTFIQAAEVAKKAGEAQATDLQGTVLTMLGRSADPRLSHVSVPPFGRGAWAITWEQALRYLRFERATAVYSLVFIGLFGAGLGLLVRYLNLASFWLWLVPLAMPLLSQGSGYLADELRQPHIFLIPAAPWRRLLATAVVPWFDVSLDTSLMLWTSVLVGTVGRAGAGFASIAASALASWLLLLALCALGQATVLLGTVIVPSWLPPFTRSLLRFMVFVLCLVLVVPLPVLGLLAGGSVRLALLLAAAGAVAITALVLVVAARLFDRLESPA